MIKWEPIITQAAAIVASYDTSVILRQLFYRLVAAELLPNTQTAYKTLSSKTAEAHRAGTFPKLMWVLRKMVLSRSCNHGSATWVFPSWL